MSTDDRFPGLVLIGRGSTTDITNAITGDPSFTRPLSGAITLQMDVADPDPRRPLLNSPTLASHCYATYGGVNFQLSDVDKQGSKVQLTFVDAIAWALADATGTLTIPASTQTRQQIAERLCREAGVQVLCDPESRGVVNAAVERKDDASSWDVLGQLADDIGWRRFTDGRRVYFGSDAWLAGLSSPRSFREFTGPVHTIDFKLSAAQPANTITLDVDAELWAVPPGQGFTVEGMGLASGDWVVTQFSRPLTKVRGKVTGARRGLVIPEPPPSQTAVAGESGESTFVPAATDLQVPPPGKYGGKALDGAQIAIAVTIVRSAVQHNVGRRGAIVGLMTAFQESGMRNLDYGDRDSLGVFQQRPSQGWGTPAQVRNVEYSAGKFFDALVKVTGWASLDYTVAAQKVQRSAFPNAYAKHQGAAEALYQAIVAAAAAKAGVSATTAKTDLDKVADIAVELAGKGWRYDFGGKQPPLVDCSGFVALVYKQYGKPLAGGSKQQFSTLKAAGKLLSVKDALATRGAILFRMSGDPTHIAFSLGDGRTAEARGTAAGVGIFDGADSRTWTNGGSFS